MKAGTFMRVRKACHLRDLNQQTRTVPEGAIFFVVGYHEGSDRWRFRWDGHDTLMWGTTHSPLVEHILEPLKPHEVAREWHARVRARAKDSVRADTISKEQS